MPYTSIPKITQEEFGLFRDLIYKHSGIVLADQKAELVRGRLLKRIREHGLDTFQSYYELIKGQASGDELIALIDAISTNKTDFFREAAHFDFLEKELLPEIIADKNKRNMRRFRVWSAGCSTGEEPYSLSLVLNRLKLNDEIRWDAKILATDISTRALRHALRGEYSRERLAPISPADLLAYFKKAEDGGYRVGKDLQNLIKFARLNLLTEKYPFRGPFDFIFCRNVMIYFDHSTCKKLVNHLHSCLAPGGHLFVGHSESLSGLKSPFTYLKPAVYQRAAE